MKNYRLKLLLSVSILFCAAGSLFAQAVVCPTLAANSPVLSCSTPCTTLTATPSVNLAGTNTYSVAAVTYAPLSYTTGTNATFAGGAWSGGTDDSYGDQITLPFNFCFFGTSYNKIAIGTNGNITFNATGGGSLVNGYDPYLISGPLPGGNCAATENCIMGVWNDTYVGGGGIKYASYGTAPCRQFVISWNAVDLFLPGTYCTGNTTTSQIVLYESSNIIDIYIGRRMPCAGWNGGLSVCGIENNAGTVFYCPPGENGTTYSATNLGWRFTPTGATSSWTYNWVAPGGASVGTTASVAVCPATTTVYTVTATSTACSGISVSTTATVTTTGSSTPITGTPTMCLGSTTALTDATTGGVWSSSNTGVATVNTTGLVTSVSGGTSTISYTVAGCTAIDIVTVNTFPVISGPTTVCSGSTITLTSSVPGVTWSSSNTGIATVGATTGVVTGVAPGILTIYCPPTGCVSSYTVTVEPVAPITGTASLCMGNTTTLSSTITGGTWSSSTTGIATVNASGLVNGVSGGTATISYSTGGCISTRIVTVNPVAAITGPTALCVGGTTPLTDAVTGGTWLSGNTGVATISATGVVTGGSAGTSIITYTTPAGCTSFTTVNVVILTAITGTMVVCQNNTVTLFDGGGGGVWSSGNTGIATIGASSGIVTGVSGGTATITYTGGGGCYTTTVVTVNPISPITGALGMCVGFTTTLGDALTGGTWSSSAPGVATVNSSTGIVTGVTAGNATIAYILPTGCETTTVVTVHPKPAKPVVSPITYCQFNLANALTATPTTGLLWYGPGVTAGSAVQPTPSTATAGITDYYVTETSTFGCVSDSAVLPVTITAQPAPPVTHPVNYCQFSPTVPLNYQVDSAPGSQLNWYLAATGGAPIGFAPLPNNAIVTYPLGTTYYVSQTVNGCESNRAPVTVTIVYLPSFSITDSKSWVCDHDTLSFAYSGNTPLVSGTYQWQLPPGASFVGSNGTTSSVTVRFDSVNGPHILYLTVGELNNMCTSTDTISITVIPPPITYAYMKPDVCLGDTVNLAISSKSADAASFSWFIDGTPLTSSGEVNFVAANSNSGGPYSLSWNTSGIHFITVTCTTNEGCTSVPTVDTIDVHPLPNATFTVQPKATGTLCLEDSVLFTANDIDANAAYLWQPEHFFNNNNHPNIWGKVELEKSEVMLTVTDPFGCKASTTQEIDPNTCCTVLFPNAFTPNGDGKNDLFRPIFNGYHRFHNFTIMNRWGQIVFESANSNPQWDGNVNGVPQDIGVYFYYIKYDCGGNTIEQKGDCTLVR